MTSLITAEQQRDAIAKAVEAVRTKNASDVANDPNAYWNTDEQARRTVTDAVTIYGTTAAQIATLAGVGQLAIIELIDDNDARADALVQARHDAERYQRDIMERIRGAALRRYYAGEQKIRICERLAITRPSLDAWIRESEAEGFQQYLTPSPPLSAGR